MTLTTDAKILPFARPFRSLLRDSGATFAYPKKKLYKNIRLRTRLPKQKFNKLLKKTWSRVFHELQCAGAFDATTGFKKYDWAAVGRWEWVVVDLKAAAVEELLEALDELCEEGLLEIEVEGSIMGRSKSQPKLLPMPKSRTQA